MAKKIDLDIINTKTQEEFTEVLADIYEHSSWIPHRAWHDRPFKNVEELNQCMLKIIEDSNVEEQLALLRSHPELAGKEAQEGALTKSSHDEQKTAKLDALSKDEINEISTLNRRYNEKHGFPFIIAVKYHTKESIFEEFRKRIQNTTKEERRKAIWQVALIAGLRLKITIN